MSTLLEQLQRESDDLCGHRGLTPGTKTFETIQKLKKQFIFKGKQVKWQKGHFDCFVNFQDLIIKRSQ